MVIRLTYENCLFEAALDDAVVAHDEYQAALKEQNDEVKRLAEERSSSEDEVRATLDEVEI